MSTTHALPVDCPRCLHAQRVLAVESANVDRHPRFHHDVLAGSFMRFACTRCGAPFVLERELLYSHVSAGLFAGVFPSALRARARQLELMIDRVFHETLLGHPAPPVRALAARVQPRVVFGYDELREKVLCWDRGLDDRALEVLKLHLLLERRELYRDGFAGLLLTQVDRESLTLCEVSDDPACAPRRLVVERAAYDRVVHRRPSWAVQLEGYLSRPYVSLRQPAVDPRLF